MMNDAGNISRRKMLAGTAAAGTVLRVSAAVKPAKAAGAQVKIGYLGL